MGKVKKYHFYYGAIINAILENNRDASAVLISGDKENRQVYKMLTNTAKEECILFLKYCSDKNRGNTNYFSWNYSFSQEDKKKLRKYNQDEKLPIFICLLGEKKTGNSEIVVVKYDEFLSCVGERNNLTVGLEAGKHHFLLFKGESKERKNTFKIPTNRISKSFDDLSKEVIKESKYLRSQKNDITITLETIVDQQVETYENSELCPVCNRNLYVSTLQADNLSIRLKKCLLCQKIYFGPKSYEVLCRHLKRERLSENVCIMKEGEADEETIEQISVKKIKRDELTYVSYKDIKASYQNQRIIYLMDAKSNECPIHHTKMKYEVIDFGRGRKDSVYYCHFCNKKIIPISRKNDIEKLIGMKGSVVKFEFKKLQ